MQINKSDRNDAVGIARIMQCGWYKEVRVKDLDSHAVRALLVSLCSRNKKSPALTRGLIRFRLTLRNAYWSPFPPPEAGFPISLQPGSA